MDEFCFKEIVLNTRLDLYHSCFMDLVYEFLIILQISSYEYVIYLLFLPITSFFITAYN